MPVIHYATKNAARAASHCFLLGTTAFSVLATILGLAPDTKYGEASGQLVAVALAYLGAEAQGAAADPPRADYTTPTRSRRRELPYVPYDFEVAAASRDFGAASSYAAAYVSAFVRALERSQTAEEKRETKIMLARLGEADSYASRGSDMLYTVSNASGSLAETLDADRFLRERARARFEGRAGQALLDTPYWEKLPAYVMDVFDEIDFDATSLRSAWQDAWQPLDPVHSCAQLLRSASREASSLANALREWGPEPTPQRLDALS